MSYWKILGGIAAGVGTVVALPIAGPIGAVTALGAAIAGTLGGVAGVAVAMSDEEDNDAAYRKGELDTAAKYKEKEEKLIKALKEAEDKLGNDRLYFQLLIALFAVGIAAANVNGKASQEKIDTLEEFITGSLFLSIPPHIKKEIDKLKFIQPNFNTAREYVKKIDNPDIKLFESIIEFISESDGKATEEERAFLAAFKVAA